MKKSVLFLLMVSLLLSSCSENNTTTETNDNQKDIVEKIIPVSSAIETKELETTTNGDQKRTRYRSEHRRALLIIDDKSMGQSLSVVKVVTKGFSSKKDTIDFGEISPVEKVMQTDLNKDGIAELIMFLRSAGSGSYGEVCGITYDKDDNISKIKGYEMSSKEFEGYMGHDAFSIEDNYIVTTYPVYKKDDPNSSPSGGKAKVFLGMVKDADGWSLKPVKKETTE